MNPIIGDRFVSWSSLGRMSFRLMGMAGRLALTLYIARYLGLEAVASYGLVVGGTAIMTTVTGLGIDYQLNRLSVHGVLQKVMLRVRDRMIVRILIGAILIFLGLTLTSAHGNRLPVAGAVILLLEPLISDVQSVLVFRGYPMWANALLFMRAGAWVFPVIALGIAFPQFRSIDIVYIGWCGSLLIALTLAGGVMLAHGRGQLGWRRSVDWLWLLRTIVGAKYVFVSELGFASTIYLDRYLIAVVLGSNAAGTFVFIWSLTNAAVPLVQAGIFDKVTPSLARLWQAGDITSWLTEVERAKRHTLILAGCLGAGLLVAILLLLPWTRVPLDHHTVTLVVLMIGATITRLFADMLHHALYSSQHDKYWVAVNIISLLIAPIIGVVSIITFGLVGAGVYMLLMAIVVLVMRLRLLRLVRSS